MEHAWAYITLVIALGISKALQDHLAFRTPWESGWFSVTWRWRDLDQWYDETAERMRSKWCGFLADPFVEICTNIQTLISDAWHFMAMCQGLAIGGLAFMGDLAGISLTVLLYVLTFEYFFSRLGSNTGKESHREQKVR